MLNSTGKAEKPSDAKQPMSLGNVLCDNQARGTVDKCCPSDLQQQQLGKGCFEWDSLMGVGCINNCVELPYLASEPLSVLEARIIGAHRRLWQAPTRISYASSDENDQSSNETTNQTYKFSLVTPKLQFTPRPPRTGSFVMRAASKKWCEVGSVTTAATAESSVYSTSSQVESSSVEDIDADDEIELILSETNVSKNVTDGNANDSPCRWGYFVDCVSPLHHGEPDQRVQRRTNPLYRRFLAKEIAASEGYDGMFFSFKRPLQGQQLHRVDAQRNLLNE